ncbi:MAG TPA: transposase [Thermoanaerobaculia bacterium]|nr:transposase [Thermoanaerobaculia bacterium]HUM30620.1 transposase [Thermoanaerobaculia bacterium]HXK68852.1 transposase [Thermoanaerobaculia bacterium]
MARIARVVVPNIPHHVTQRGNRNQQVFFQNQDYEKYLSLLKTYTEIHNVSIWAYCLMPNHVHLIAVPHDKEGLTGAIREVHRRYTRMINFRYEWRGHLWQSRYASYPMDQHHLLAAARYIERNPVSANIVARPEDWEWSSARHHLGIQIGDLISKDDLLPSLINQWTYFLASNVEESDISIMKRHQNTGRPLGDKMFISLCETLLERTLLPKKPGPRGPWKYKQAKKK